MQTLTTIGEHGNYSQIIDSNKRQKTSEGVNKLNKEQLLAAAEVMRRAAEGELPQFRSKVVIEDWEDETCGLRFAWDWSRYEYRIKPKIPREIFVPNFSMCRYEDLPFSARFTPLDGHVNTKFREVLE